MTRGYGDEAEIENREENDRLGQLKLSDDSLNREQWPALCQQWQHSVRSDPTGAEMMTHLQCICLCLFVCLPVFNSIVVLMKL